ncbi:MAG: DsrE family protein [Allgaiera sp.]|jgi:intracellular sulfur oxidation DsrE/DsrF family protein|nr:DsrE family protein [Allgaiera sp.]
MMIRKTAAAALFCATMAATGAHAKEHHIVFQIDDGSPQRMNLVLNNVSNIEDYYKSRGDTVKINVVAYGPGLKMLIKDQSPVATRIAAMALEHSNLEFDACHNTMMAIEKKTGKPVKLIGEATVVPGGVAKIVELQEEGYAYVKP